MALRIAMSRSSASAASSASRASPRVAALASTSPRFFSSNPLASFVGADQTTAQNKIYHKTNTAVLLLTPVALIAHPSPLSMPIDVALSVIFPLHAHFGMNWIITDYVSKDPNHAARYAMAAATVFASLGLLKLSLTGEGITGTLKGVWTAPAAKEDGEVAAQ